MQMLVPATWFSSSITLFRGRLVLVSVWKCLVTVWVPVRACLRTSLLVIKRVRWCEVLVISALPWLLSVLRLKKFRTRLLLLLLKMCVMQCSILLRSWKPCMSPMSLLVGVLVMVAVLDVVDEFIPCLRW